jgi:glycine cleavage system H protein
MRGSNLGQTTQVTICHLPQDIRAQTLTRLFLLLLLGIVGITQQSKKDLGQVVFIAFSVKEYDTITAGRAIAMVEGQTSAQDVFSPISGRVVQVNWKVEERPSLISDGDEDWLIRIALDSTHELGELMSADEYKKFCEG